MSMYDMDGDGYIDHSAYDSTGDGWLDGNAVDTNGDQYADTWLIDSNQNGLVDTYAYDTTGDGYADTFDTDGNEDGWVELRMVDTDGDALPDTTTGVYSTDWSGGTSISIQSSSGILPDGAVPTGGTSFVIYDPDPIDYTVWSQSAQALQSLQEQMIRDGVPFSPSAAGGYQVFDSAFDDYDRDGRADDADHNPTDPSRH